jgi:hypothetical protein
MARDIHKIPAETVKALVSSHGPGTIRECGGVAAMEAVKQSRIAGETACATEASGLLSAVGQTVPSALPACGRFFHSFHGRYPSGAAPDHAQRHDAQARHFPQRPLVARGLCGARIPA